MRRRVRRISQSLSWMLVLAAVVPDVRWCEAAWADLPVECLLASESSAACAAAPSESPPDDGETESSCPLDEPIGCGGSCPIAPFADRAWCPSDALGAEALPGQAPTMPTLDLASGVLPDETAHETPAPARAPDPDGIPPPLDRQPRARPPVRAPPQV